MPDNPPKWFKEYSFKDFYEVTDLSPDTLNIMLTNKWMKQESLMTKVSYQYVRDIKIFESEIDEIFQFWQKKVKQSDAQLAKGCDDKCRYKTFCQIVMCP